MSAREPASASAPNEKGSARYPKSRRILKRKDFLRVQERPDSPVRDSAPPRPSARVTTAHFVMLLSRRPDAETPGEGAPSRPRRLPCRLGVVASKKTGGAVVRNRSKRLLREAFRLRNELFPAGIDLVIIAKPGASDLSLDAVIHEVAGVASLLGRRANQVLQK